MTFEFPLTETHGLHGKGRSWYTVTRLRRLAAIAVKLYRAGWPVWVTMMGLAFEPPGLDKLPENDDEYYEQLELVGCQLADLGIDEEFEVFASKTEDQLPHSWLDWIRDPAEALPTLPPLV
jgi:hypothetical protein